MARMARWCFRKRWTVLISWVVVLVVTGAASQALKATYSNDYSLPKTDSSQALAILKQSYPSRAGDTDQVVMEARTGTLLTPAIRARVDAMLAKVAHDPHVVKVTSPYAAPTQMAKDDKIGFATVNLNQEGQNVSKATSGALISTAKSFATSTFGHPVGRGGH